MLLNFYFLGNLGWLIFKPGQVSVEQVWPEKLCLSVMFRMMRFWTTKSSKETSLFWENTPSTSTSSEKTKRLAKVSNRLKIRNLTFIGVTKWELSQLSGFTGYAKIQGVWVIFKQFLVFWRNLDILKGISRPSYTSMSLSRLLIGTKFTAKDEIQVISTLANTDRETVLFLQIGHETESNMYILSKH